MSLTHVLQLLLRPSSPLVSRLVSKRCLDQCPGCGPFVLAMAPLVYLLTSGQMRSFPGRCCSNLADVGLNVDRSRGRIGRAVQMLTDSRQCWPNSVECRPNLVDPGAMFSNFAAIAQTSDEIGQDSSILGQVGRSRSDVYRIWAHVAWIRPNSAGVGPMSGKVGPDPAQFSDDIYRTQSGRNTANVPNKSAALALHAR